MVASPRQRLILPLAPTGAGVAGVLVALVFAVMPTGTLESLVVDSGIASLVNAAQPPLGFTARAMLALLGGGVATGLAWVALFVVVGTRSVILNPRAGGAAPTLRRGDVHPDAPPREPVFANRDLGTPFLEVRAEPSAKPTPAATDAERALPADLDTPLAAFDPHSFVPSVPAQDEAPAPLPIRTVPMSAMELIAAATRQAPFPVPTPAREDSFEAHDRRAILRDEPDASPMPIRLDTGHAIDLIAASMQQPAPAPQPAQAESSDSIRALLDRLERSVAQREAPAPATAPTRQQRQDSIRDTLATLRGLATRAG